MLPRATSLVLAVEALSARLAAADTNSIVGIIGPRAAYLI